MTTIIGADAAKLAGLQIDTLQKMRRGQITLSHWEWFNMLTKEERDRLMNASMREFPFALIVTFDLVVPTDYNHATRLTDFAAAHRKEFKFSRRVEENGLTDANFFGATTRLVSGRKFKVKVFQIIQRASSEDCLAFLQRQNAVLVGAQGLSLAYELARDQLPVGKKNVSFDEKDALWKDPCNCRNVPSIYRHPDGDWYFNFDCFMEGRWGDDSCLLCFCDPPT